MIVKTSKGYVVKSEKGKTLSKPYSTKQQAQKRLNQIDYFANKKKWDNREIGWKGVETLSFIMGHKINVFISMFIIVN